MLAAVLDTSLIYVASLYQGVGIEWFHCIQRCQGVGIERFQRCPHFRREVPLYTEVSSFSGCWNRGSTGVLISGCWNRGSTVYRGVLISGCWNRGVPLYI